MIGIGRQICAACRGDCGAFGADRWIRCTVCGGFGHTWLPGGPRFGAPFELGDRRPGEIVELATGERCRISWHMPRKNPTTTFVALIDEWTDEESLDRIPVDSAIGVVSVAAKKPAGGDDDAHAGEKDADVVDPLAARVRAGAEGSLL